MIVTHDTIKAGDKVLILGASGGVGTGCVVLAKQLGAHVIACAGSQVKCDALLALGADEAINYNAVDFSKSGGREATASRSAAATKAGSTW